VRRLLVVSALALLAFLAVYLLAVQTEVGQRADEAALTGGRDAPARAQDAADRFLRVISFGSLLAAIVVLSGLAWLRRRPGLLLVPAAVIGTSLVATELFKHLLLERPDLVPDPRQFGNSYPSGHTTVMISIGMAAVLIAAPRLRLAVAFVAATLAAAVGVFVVTADWHRPSDPIGSYLLTLSVAAATMAALRAWRPGHATRTDPVPGRAGGVAAARLELAALLAGAAVFVGAGVIASLRYGAEVDWNRLHVAYLLSSAAIVAAAGLCVAALLRALQELPAGSAANDLG
jgi:membrane-associated phospholipid phosphatase